jgi:hypothetical protein
VIRKSLIGKNTTINVEFKNGKSCTYNHDEVYNIMKDTLSKLPCFIKYNSYTSSTNVPVVVRNIMKDTLSKLPCFIKYNSYTSSTNVPVVVRKVVEVQ